MTADQHREAFKLAQKFFASVGRNSKTGATYTWSIEAVTTCPGATEACTSVCYARRLAARRNRVRSSWISNTELSRRDDFPQILTAALAMLPPRLLRLHVSGDFYSTAYIDAWATALAANSHIHPWCYTRSWRIPELLEQFKASFGTIPTWLLASTDRNTGPAPDGWRTAHMNHEIRKTHKKAVSPQPGITICPEQTEQRATCADCGLCGGTRITTNGTMKKLRSVPVEITFALH